MKLELFLPVRQQEGVICAHVARLLVGVSRSTDSHAVS